MFSSITSFRPGHCFLSDIVARFKNKRKEGCKISQLPKPPSTSPGHFSDRTFFVTLAMTRFSSLLSVINIDSLFVCLQMTLLSFLLLLCSGKLPLRRRVKSRNGKPSRFFTHVFLARNFKLSYNESTERSCQSESEARICTEILTGTQ